MFIVIPYRSDVVARQFIWGTVGLIAANLAVVVILGFPSRTLLDMGADTAFIDHWVLRFGTFNPLTWITCAFTHFDWWHVGFNMAFLWAFGFVAEGLLGWRRFLLVYFAMAAANGGLVQLLWLGSEGGAAGASAVVMGVMALAALWSPKNELTVFLWILTVFRMAARVRVLTFCVLWVALDVVLLALQGFSMSSALLHVFGAVIGVGTGLLMLKKGWVDTEGWDLLSLRRGDPRARRQAELHRMLDPLPRRPEPPLADTLVEVRDALAAGDPVRAEEAYARGRRTNPEWILPEEDLRALLSLLLKDGRLEPAVARMEEYVEAYPERSIPVRLRLAEGYVETRRPTKALDEIARLDGMPLTDAQRARTRELEQRACDDRQSGRLELE
jgi:membrane associated rhomboid family serine protease